MELWLDFIIKFLPSVVTLVLADQIFGVFMLLCVIVVFVMFVLITCKSSVLFITLKQHMFWSSLFCTSWMVTRSHGLNKCDMLSQWGILCCLMLSRLSSLKLRQTPLLLDLYYICPNTKHLLRNLFVSWACECVIFTGEGSCEHNSIGRYEFMVAFEGSCFPMLCYFREIDLHSMTVTHVTYTYTVERSVESDVRG